MKHTWLLGALAGVMLASSAAAQTPPQTSTPSQSTPAAQAPSTQKPTMQTPSTQEPTTPPSTEQPAAPATTTRPRTTTAQRAEVPTGETVLGTVTIPRTVMADGKTLPAGRYTVRLTAQAAQPTVAGQLPDLNRWVEFVQGGATKGREVVSIVPADEVNDTQQGPDLAVGKSHVPRNSSRVEMLKGGEYLRVWFNRGGNNYLVHLPPAGAAAPKAR